MGTALKPLPADFTGWDAAPPAQATPQPLPADFNGWDAAPPAQNSVQPIPGLERLGGAPPGVPRVALPDSAQPTLADRAASAAVSAGQSLSHAATTPLAEQAHELLGTGMHAASMTGLYDQAMPALVDKAKGAIDTVFGRGTSDQLPQDFPWLEFTGNLANEVARSGMSLMDFGSSPAGMAATGGGMGALPAAVRPAVGAGFAASMAPETAKQLEQAVADPTASSIPKAIVRTAVNALPIAATVPFLRTATDALSDRLDEHNAKAAELVQQERVAGNQLDLAQRIHGDPIPIEINGTPHSIELAGVNPKTGRPIFQVMNTETGKAAFAGYGANTQEFLRSNEAAPAVAGAEPLPADFTGWDEKPPVAAEAMAEPAAGMREAPPLPEEAPPATLDDYLGGRTSPANEAEPPQPTAAVEPAATQPPSRTPAPASETAADPERVSGSRFQVSDDEAGFFLSQAGVEEPDAQHVDAMRRQFEDALDVAPQLGKLNPTKAEMMTAAAQLAAEEPRVQTPTGASGRSGQPESAAADRPIAHEEDEEAGHAAQPAAVEPGRSEPQPGGSGPVGSSAAGDAGRAAPTLGATPLVELPLDQIHVNPSRFQFKANVGQGGAGDEFREVTKWDPEKAGVIAVWRDPANGQTYVVNGHHRMEMAQRLGAPTITSRYLNAATAPEARTKGALINIAEGRGDATDAAKVFRDSGFTEQRLKEEGVSLKGQKARQGLALANLEPGLFDRVVAGDLPAERGAIIGEGVQEHEDQRALASMLADRERSGRRVTNDQLAEMIRLTNEAPKQTDTQDSLFGPAEMQRSLIPEKAEISDYVRSRLGREKRLFAAVGTEGAAAQLGEAGNVIQSDVNRARAGDTGAALAIYDKLSSTAGPVSDALDGGARSLAKGENGNAVKEQSYAAIRRELVSQAARLRAGEGAHPAVRGEGAAELGAGRARETGQGQRADHPVNAVEPHPIVRSPGERGSFSGRDAGPHGPIFREFHHDAAGAIAKLRELQSGDAVGALHHPEVGDIDLIWGEAGPKGYGLAKIAERHPEVLDHLQQIVSKLPVTRRTAQTIFLEDPRHTALVRLNYLQQQKTWLLTAYEKAPSTGRTIDVPGTHAAERQAPPPGGVEPSLPERTTGVSGTPVTESRGTPPRKGDSSTSITPSEAGEKPPEGTRKPGERGSFSFKPSEGLFTAGEERAIAEEQERGADKLLGDQLTAQVKSGLAAKPAKLKPAKNRGLFDKEGPEQTGLFGSERGSLPLSREPAGPRLNYSGLGRAEDITVRNLSQLEKADPEAHAAVVRAATAKAQSAAIIQEAAPRIEQALGKNGPSFTDFRKALIEGKLRAIRERYLLTAKGVARFSDQQMENGLEHNPELTSLLRKIEGQRGVPQDVIETAAGLEAQGKLGELRDFLRQTLQDAAANVAHILPEEDYNRIRASAGYQRALGVYRGTFENRLARIHARNEGVFSTAKGDAYYPLVPVTAAEKLAAKPLGKASPYRAPVNVHNEFATGLATYDAGMEAFGNNLARAAGANNKAAAIRTLEENGWLRVLDEGERAPSTVNVHGIEEKAKVLETNAGKQVERNGRTEYRPSVAAVMPAWLAKELQPVFDKGELPGGWARKVTDAINWWSIQGPPALAWHGTNLVGTIVANTPFVGESLATKTIGNIPGVKIVTAIGKLLATDVTSDEAASRFVRMAEQGTLPPNFRSVTYSKKFADQTGAKLGRVTLAPLLYGRKGLDARARLLMDRLYDQMVPEAERKDLDRYKFVNQLGQYTTSLESAMARAAKKGGLAPFATAGTTMWRNGINAALGTGPVPGNKFSYRLAQIVSGGTVGLAALWVASYRAYTGKWPWQDPNAKLMQYPLKPQDRNSALGRAICGTKPGTCYVSLAIANPLLARGLGALGVTNAFETHQLGGSGGQMLESAIKGAANAVAHPFVSGPVPRAASVLALGKEPYLTGVHPVALFPATKRTKPGLPWLGERAKEATLSMNPFLQDVAAGVGLGHKADEAQKQGAWWLRMAVNLAAPRLGAGVSDQGHRAEMLERAKGREEE